MEEEKKRKNVNKVLYRPSAEVELDGRDNINAVISSLRKIQIVFILIGWGAIFTFLGIPILWVFLLLLTFIITSEALIRGPALSNIILPSRFIIYEDMIKLGDRKISPSEAPKTIIRSFKRGLNIQFPRTERSDRGSAVRNSSYHLIGFNEADIAPIANALQKAKFNVTLDMNSMNGWKKWNDTIVDKVDCLFFLCVIVFALVFWTLLGWTIGVAPPPGQSSSPNLAEIMGVIVIIVGGTIFKGDRISVWRGRRLIGQLHGCYEKKVHCQIHWGNAIAMDTMDSAKLLYTRWTDHNYGEIFQNQQIVLASARKPQLSICVKEMNDDSIIFIVGTISKTIKEDGSGEKDLTVKSIQKGIDSRLNSLYNSVLTRKKGEMIEFH